jgi:hypothetical protein
MNKPDLLNRSFPTPLAAGEEDALSTTSHNFRYTAWAVMIIYLINKYPQHFPDSLKEEVIKYKLFAVEDVYRAYCLLRQA